MNAIRAAISVIIVILACVGAEAQSRSDSIDIFIKQSNSEKADLPEKRTQFNEQTILNQNAISLISIFYPEQDEWITISSSEDLQRGTSELIGNFEAGLDSLIIRDSLIANGNGRNEDRLAELMGSMISGDDTYRNDENSDTGTRVAADEEMMNAFREAFEAVMQEDSNDDADPDHESQEGDTVELPLMYRNVDGIVLDETRSKTGRDFYNAFYAAWSKNKGVENSIVRVAEKPGPGMVSIVFVEVNYEEIFELRLRPGDQRTRRVGEIAAARTLSFLKDKSSKILTY